MTRTEHLDSPRILAGVAGVLEVLVYQDGVLTDPAALPAPTCSVVDGAGNAVASGNATIVGGSSGKLTFALTAAQNASPNLYTATWTFTIGGVSFTLTSKHESLGQLLFTLAEARAYDGSAMSDATTYPSDTILRASDQILDAFEQITGQAFGTRYRREVLDGPARSWDYGGYGSQTAGELELPDEQVSLVRTISERTAGTQTWTAYTAQQLADVLVYPNGKLVRETLGSFQSGRRCIAVEYEYGWNPIPEEIRQAALRLLRNILVKSNLPDRATVQTDELGTFSLAVAGKPGQWFGIPLVDSVLNRPQYTRLPGVR